MIPALFLLAILLCAPAGVAAEPFDSTACEKCHVGVEPAADQRSADYPKTLHHIDWGALKASVHARAGLGCTDCHAQGYVAYPHANRKLMTCFDCHSDARGEFQAIKVSQAASVHGDVLGCRDCHDPHAMKRAAEQTVGDKDRPCIGCHQDAARANGRTMVQLHSWHPQAALHLAHVPCVACHTQPDAANRGFSHRIRPGREASRRCEECHSPEGKMVFYLNRLGSSPEARSGTQMAHRFYLSGSTRARRLDTLGLGLLGLVGLGVVIHGSLRVAARRRR